MTSVRSVPERELEELFEDAPCGYIAAFPDGRIVKVNRTLASWLAQDVAVLEDHKTFQQLLTIPSRIYFATHLAPLLQMQGYFRGVALDLAREGLTPLHALVDCVHKTDASGNSPMLRMIITDATLRRRYEEELLLAKRTAEEATVAERAARELAERASRAKDDVLAIVSHELKTPLSAILGWIHVLRKQTDSNSAIENGLDVIERNARVQVRLIDDLLDMSRVIAGKLRLQVERVNLSTAIEAALESVQPAAQAKQVRLQPVLDSGVFVSGDPARLQQIFWNLLTNAVKFTPKGGSVRVVMERVNSHTEVGVIDSGAGMTPQLLSRVFDRFRQSDSPDTRKTAGLGLGLSLVKNLVEMHGGAIEARSAGEGHGSTFVVSLPAIAIHHGAQEPDSPTQMALTKSGAPRSEISLLRLKIMVVDDDADAREALERTLSASGALVLAAGSSHEALLRMEEFRPDVLISDIDMPGEDGYEFIRKVRMRSESTQQLPAIALTAKSRIQDRTEALLSGFQTHMAKPVDAHELVITIASLADRLGRAEP